MYEAFYGFRETPFHLPPDPNYVFMSEPHVEALTHLEYAIQGNKGFVVITGEIGAGKTTLMHLLLKKVPQEVVTAVINQTHLLPLEFIQRVCEEFEIAYEITDKAFLLDAFHHYLLDQYANRRRVILLIDEAQNLPAATLEELRMLSNLETEKEHIIQMILLGQPNLRDKLGRKGLEQFVQRVTVYYHIRGLAPSETNGYIRHRLHVAGGDNPEIFTPEAVRLIHKASKGIPRMINILCDGALVYGYADGLPRIDEATVAQVIEERGGLGTVSNDLPEAETLAEADIVERMARVEQRLDRLVERIDQHLTFQENRDREIEKRFGLKATSVLAGWSKTHIESRMDRIERLLRRYLAASRAPLPPGKKRPASKAAPFLSVDTAVLAATPTREQAETAPVTEEERGIHADPPESEATGNPGSPRLRQGLFSRVLNQIRS